MSRIWQEIRYAGAVEMGLAETVDDGVGVGGAGTSVPGIQAGFRTELRRAERHERARSGVAVPIRSEKRGTTEVFSCGAPLSAEMNKDRDT